MTDRTKTELTDPLSTLGHSVEELGILRAQPTQAVELFRKSLKGYQAIVEGTTEGILISDVETKRFHYANPAICRMLGYSESELLLMSVSDLPPPDALEKALNEFEAQARGEKPFVKGVPCLRKDGTVVYADITSARTLIHDRKFLLSFFTDGTEQRLAEEALRISEEKYRLHFENTNDIICSVDSEFRFIDVSPSVEKVLGYQPDEMIGKTFQELNLLAPEYLEKALADTMRVFAGEHISSAVYEFITKDGSRKFGELSNVPIFCDGKVVASISVGRDITERKWAEDALKESEEKHRVLFESSHDAVMTLAPPSWKFTNGNPATVEMFRARDEADLTSRAPWEYSPECQHDGRRSAEKAREMIEIAMKQGSHFFEWTHKRIDGTEFLATVLLTRMRLEKQDMLQATVRDITDRKLAEDLLKKAHNDLEDRVAERTIQLEQANERLQREIDQRRKTEQELRESEVKWRSLVENAPDFILILDQNYVISYINRTAENIKLEDVIGKSTIYDHIAAETHDQVNQALETVFHTGQPADFEAYSPEIDRWFASRVGPIHRDGVVVSAIILSHDITKRKQAEAALKESEKRYRTLFDQAVDSIVLLEPTTGEIVEFNESAHLNLGYSREEFQKLTIPDFEALESEEEFKEHVGSINRESGDIFETKHRTKDGEIKTILVNCKMISLAGRNLIQSFWHDITERKQSEDQARHHLAELAHVSRVSTVGEMATGIAHELNQPLMAITGFSDAASKLLSDKKPADVGSMLLKIGEQAQRAGQIIRRMRSFVRKSESYHSTVEINQLVQEVVDLATADARMSNIRLLFKSGEAIPEIYVDRIQIQQVVLNLLKNAFDALSGQDDADRLVTIETFETDDQYVEVAVKDNGIGLSAKDAEQIFEMFFTSKSEGMGMGLAICRSIIEVHNGRLWVQPNEDVGATFRFTLPLGKSGVH